MNNELRYMYGYNLGWNERNEYIESFQNLFENYKNQLKILKKIEEEKLADEATRRKIDNLTEEELRDTYNAYYSNSNISFEQYKKDVVSEYEKSNIEITQRESKKREIYNANVYYLIDIKEQTIREVNKELTELEHKLKQNEIDISQQSLYFSYPEKMDNPLAIRAKLDELYLENKKLKHAISELKNMRSELKLTLEESKLRLRGLNPREREYYDRIKKKKYVSPELVIEYYGNYDTDYEEKLAKYQEKMVEYENDCQKISKMYKQVLNGEISQQEFELFEQEMEEKYAEIKERYNKFVDYKEKILEQVKEGKLWHPLLRKDQIEELKSIGVNKPEGEQYIHFLTQNGLTTDYINESRKPIDFHDLLNELAKEYDEEEKSQEYLDIDELINYIKGEDLKVDYKWYNKFDKMLSKLKYWNREKINGKSFLNKPMKVVRTAIATGAKGIEKLLRFKKTESKINEMLERVNSLSEKQLHFILSELTHTELKEKIKTLPNLIAEALESRLEYYAADKDIDIHEKARDAYSLAHDEWEASGYWTKVGEKITRKPELTDFEQEYVDETMLERGLTR